MTLRLALYGKGGIGKSTLATHLSTAFARKGLRVLHIGCDPKSDSVRNLAKERIPTVLETLSKTPTPTQEELLFPGAFGVTLVEAGGPVAGQGCAGLGILAMADTLERLGVFAEGWDIILYDVLGDVVCGGFAMPMRQGFVDRVFLVTSAEYMALYAANNILKGIAHYERGRPLLGGILHNRCHDDGDRRIVEEFASAVGGHLLPSIPDSSALRQADFLGRTVHEMDPEGEMSSLFLSIAKEILALCPTHATALSEERLRSLGGDGDALSSTRIL